MVISKKGIYYVDGFEYSLYNRCKLYYTLKGIQNDSIDLLEKCDETGIFNPDEFYNELERNVRDNKTPASHEIAARSCKGIKIGKIERVIFLKADSKGDIDSLAFVAWFSLGKPNQIIISKEYITA